MVILPAFGAGEGSFQVPESLPAERYAAIWERAPFHLKTVASGPVNTQSFAENLALAGFSEANGVVTVYLKDKSTGEYVELTSQSPHESGIEFDKIVENDDPRQIKVSLRKGAETALVSYSQEQLTPVAAGGAPGQAAGVLGGRPPGPVPPAVPAPANADGAANQQKSRRRIILPQAAPPQSSVVKPGPGPVPLLAASQTVVSPSRP
ncbi:MAG: hypothetical protein KGS60_04740 [Verrucomicrobia bacterium]|nr:hypothetical protein [Verrucomicrobiota bacterium]